MARSGHRRITPNELFSEIKRSLEEYDEEVNESVDKAADMLSKELLGDIREDSPVRTGAYKKGWKRKKLKYTRVVYNKTHPHITHLLQNGYTTRSGKRVEGKEHIKKNEERIKERFEDLCVAIVSEGVRL